MNANTNRRIRSRTGAPYLIAFSISYEKDALLRRGLWIEHLRELLVGLARPLLRVGASIAYGGDWKEGSDNFTYELLRLINAERENSSQVDAPTPIGWLYNHLAWPLYLQVTPRVEAQWVHCCSILRITQELARIPPDERAPEQGDTDSDLHVLNAAITLSAMRRYAAEGMAVEYPDVAPSAGLKVPPQSARVLLGGKVTGYSGFLPGLFEEALLALEHRNPLYILGGFGGAAGKLVDALLPGAPGTFPQEFDPRWQCAQNPKVHRLASLLEAKSLVGNVRDTERALGALRASIEVARGSLTTHLNTGLTEDETRELMTTIEMRRAVQLTLTGLERKLSGVELAPV